MSTVPLTTVRAPAKDRTRANTLKRERHEPEYGILVATVALAAIGILMVYSSSAIKAYLSKGNDAFAIVGPQIQWAALGLVAMVVMMRVDYRWLRVASLPLFLIGIAGLLLVFLDPINIVVGGSARWIKIGPLPAVHPAEIMKLALVVYLAHWFAKRGTAVHGLLTGTLPFLVITVPVVVLVLLEPDLGTSSILAFTAFTMFFLAGANVVHLAAMAVAAVPAVVLMFMRGYQMDRDHGLAGPLELRVGPRLPQHPGLLRAGAGRRLRRRPGREPAGGRAVPAQRLQRLHLRHHRRGVRPRGGGARDRPVPRDRVPRDPHLPGRAGHLRGDARGGDHGLDLPAGVRQHRGRGGAHPRHGHPAAVRLRRRLEPHHQLRGHRHPAVGVPRDGRERNLERCAC